MKALKRLWRRDFATIRQLEHTLYFVLKPLAALMGIGIILFMTSMLSALGLALCFLSGSIMAALFVWMILLQKRPRRDVRCPFCTNVNSVFKEATTFTCDICERDVIFNERGIPMPADGSLDDVKPKSAFDVNN